MTEDKTVRASILILLHDHTYTMVIQQRSLYLLTVNRHLDEAGGWLYRNIVTRATDYANVAPELEMLSPKHR